MFYKVAPKEAINARLRKKITDLNILGFKRMKSRYQRGLFYLESKGMNKEFNKI